MRQQHEVHGARIAGAERGEVAGQVCRIEGPGRLRRQCHAVEAAGGRVPEHFFDGAGRVAGAGQPVGSGQRGGRQRAIEPLGEHGQDHVPRGRHGIDVLAAGGRATTQHGRGRCTDSRRAVFDCGRRE